ncbi:MAG: RNA methyltransferase, partial [Syntrophobacterales bacterium]|nr:RNA methyltransferase [Syntrophobacterales bacterium]
MNLYKNLYIALLHYPVYNKRGDIVTTAVTNMDIHDISRSARTYGVKRFYIITPIEQQQVFVERILHHW